MYGFGRMQAVRPRENFRCAARERAPIIEFAQVWVLDKLHKGANLMAKKTFRIVTQGNDGELRTRDFDSEEQLLKMHVQIGVDDCSTDLSLRGKPVFRGLIGPMPEGKNIVRYETPEVFEALTKEWSNAKTPKRRRRTAAQKAAEEAAAAKQ